MVPGNTWVTEPVNSMGSSFATMKALTSHFVPANPLKINELLAAP